ncbi:MAG: hypothetical protein LC640_09145 [Frankia sp.]|nr:hypothetical protein [Frankia sp.]
MDQRTIQAITGGRATTAGKKVYADDDLVLAAAKKFGLEPEGANPRALAAATETAREKVGKQLDVAYNAIDHEALGVRTSDIRRAVGRVKADLSSPSDAPVRRQLESYSQAIADRWGEGARDRIPLQALNKEITKLQNVGFAGADLSPAAGAQLKRDLAGALDVVLDRRLEEIKDLGGRIAKSSLGQREGWKGMAAAAEASQALPALNRDYRGLRLIQDIADQRAAMPAANQAAGGLRNALSNTLDVGLALTHPMAFAGKKLALPVAAAGGRAADRALARLYQASQAGSVPAQLVQDAMEAGVPRGLISRLAPGIVTDPAAEQP